MLDCTGAAPTRSRDGARGKAAARAAGGYAPEAVDSGVSVTQASLARAMSRLKGRKTERSICRKRIFLVKKRRRKLPRYLRKEKTGGVTEVMSLKNR